MLVADRHDNLVAKGKVLDSLEDTMALDGEPLRYEENDDLQANIYIEDSGWFAVTGDSAMIAGYASVSGRTLRSVEQYGRVLAKSGVVRSVRTDDEGCAFVGFKGAGT